MNRPRAIAALVVALTAAGALAPREPAPTWASSGRTLGPGAVLSRAPDAIRLTFSEPLVAARSGAHVLD